MKHSEILRKSHGRYARIALQKKIRRKIYGMISRKMRGDMENIKDISIYKEG